jgi:hypothetical protein
MAPVDQLAHGRPRLKREGWAASGPVQKKESWPARPNQLLKGFRPKAAREEEIIFYFSNPFINFKLI